MSKIIHDNVQWINNEIDRLEYKGEISDGSHTFDELYHHRMILFSVICNMHKDKAWKSKLHDDGTMFDGYFIVGIDTEEGQFSYHYHISNWNYFKVRELERAPKWDGHTSKDISRLLSISNDNGSKFKLNKGKYLVSILSDNYAVQLQCDDIREQEKIARDISKRYKCIVTMKYKSSECEGDIQYNNGEYFYSFNRIGNCPVKGLRD